MDKVGVSELANLYLAINKLDASIIKLNKAGMFDKAEQAENVINQTRELLFLMVSTIHELKNEISRMNLV